MAGDSAETIDAVRSTRVTNGGCCTTSGYNPETTSSFMEASDRRQYPDSAAQGDWTVPTSAVDHYLRAGCTKIHGYIPSDVCGDTAG